MTTYDAWTRARDELANLVELIRTRTARALARLGVRGLSPSIDARRAWRGAAGDFESELAHGHASVRGVMRGHARVGDREEEL